MAQHARQELALTAATAARQVPGVAFLRPGLAGRLKSAAFVRTPHTTRPQGDPASGVRVRPGTPWTVDVQIMVRRGHRALDVSRAVYKAVTRALGETPGPVPDPMPAPASDVAPVPATDAAPAPNPGPAPDQVPDPVLAPDPDPDSALSPAPGLTPDLPPGPGPAPVHVTVTVSGLV